MNEENDPVTLAWRKYKEVRETAWRAYVNAVNPAWEAYEKAKASASKK